MKKQLSVFVAACAGMLLFGAALITLGAVATDLKTKFNLDGIAAGTLFSILPFGILTGSLLFGPVGDRFGYKALFIFACVGIFCGFEGIAYSASLLSFNISIYLFGLGGGIINGAANAALSDISPENKGADLSLLGVFYGLGALGMPLAVGLLSKRLPSFSIVAAMGWLTLLVGIYYAFVNFPAGKQMAGKKAPVKNLFRRLLLLAAFFLFFQSSFEAIINNWATTYLIVRQGMSEDTALYGLSLHIAGMVVMRLLTGSLFRRISAMKIMQASMLMLALGVALMQASGEWIIMSGLILSGAGAAGGFPLMLGLVGSRFKELSGTAFSFVFGAALMGNMAVNYLMGIIVEKYGIRHLTAAAYAEIIIMCVLLFIIIQNLKSNLNLNLCRQNNGSATQEA